MNNKFDILLHYIGKGLLLALGGLLWSFFFTVGLYAQSNNYIQYSVTEGLPQSQVYALIQDHHGYLWLGTQGGGLSRFDGKNFETFTTADGLNSNYINALFLDSKQRVWVGTNQGITYFNGRIFQPLDNQAIAAEKVNTIYEDAQHAIWIGTTQGIFQYDESKKSFFKSDKFKGISNSIVNAFCQTPAGLWVGTNRGAWLYGNKNIRLKKEDGLPNDYISSFQLDANGILWIGTNAGTVFYDEKNNILEAPNDDAGFLSTTSILNDKKGNIWVGTAQEGLVIFDPQSSKSTLINEKNGFPHNNIKSIVEDKIGNIWVATSGGGLVKITSQAFRHFNMVDGLIGNRIYALTQDLRGKILISASQNGIQYLDSTGFKIPTPNIADLNVKCKTITVDRKNRIWAGTDGKGVVVMDTFNRRIITQSEGLPSNWIQKLLLGKEGEIWVATFSNGLARIEVKDSLKVNIRKYGISEGLTDLRISTLLTDKDGTLWFATQSGEVNSLKNGRIGLHFNQENGLPGAPIRTMIFDASGNLWVGVTDKGLYRATLKGKETKFTAVVPSKSLNSQNIYLMAFDRSGHLWTGSENGVDEWIPNPETTIFSTRHYSKSEGFVGIETCHEAVCKDYNGDLWFGTINGLTKHHSGTQTFNDAAPVLHFEDVSLFYNNLAATAYAKWVNPDGGLLPGLRFRYNDNNLSFSFKAIDLNNPDAIRYRWRLAGFQDEWAPFTTQNKVDYTNLPPGNYVFQVQACTDETILSAPLEASFTIKKPFWQFWWFRILALSVLVGGGYWLIKKRIEQIKLAEAQKRNELEVKNHLLQLEQKALQLQMNPHFIFNALNSVQALIVGEKYDLARQEINNFARLIRSILSNSRRESISLQEEIQTLEQYLGIEQFCQKNDFKFSLKTPPNLNTEEIELPPMLLQPFVENAVIHGVSHLTYPGQIDISFALEHDILCCTIHDNGIGREKSALLQQARQPGHQSAATLVTKERLEAIRENRPYKSMEINDIFNSKNEIAGTEVVIRIPLIRTF